MADRIKAVFLEALETPADQRPAYLDRACGPDTEVRRRVEVLLRAHEATNRVLDRPVWGPPPEPAVAFDARLTAAEVGQGAMQSPLVRPAGRPDDTTWPPAPEGRPRLLERGGRYRVLRLLGEGGMGAVYEAEQDNPRRLVALKVIRPGLVSPSLLRRFAQEAQILGRVQHPGIVQIYEAGVAEDGWPFFALELVRGLTLGEYAHRHDLDPAARLDLLARVCDGVQHVHDRGILHRDLKPSNILVDEAGQPKVLDFGVARALEEELRTAADRTRTGQLVGTLSYMSPEQVAGGGAAQGLDARSDVYALGVILFELLAGRLPYALEHLPLPEAVRVIREQEPVRLGALDARLRGDVETIAARALEKDRQRRYASAADLAADIRRHLRHEPIRARPPSALYQLGKFARRHRALVATTAAFLAMLLAGGGVTAWQAVALARAERDQAVRQALRSREIHEALGRAGALREQARATGEPGKWAEAREEARRAEAMAEGGPVEPGLAERVGLLLRDMNEEDADRRLVARLEGAWLLQAEVNAKENRYAGERALPEYRQAFADYGLRPGATVPAEAAARIRRRPPGVRGPALAALDNWLDMALWVKAPEAGWLERVLAAADPDEWRQRLRAELSRRDRKALEDLAREVKVAAQPAQVLVLLGRALVAGGSTEAEVEMLRRARHAYPSDFWVNHNLGWALAASRPPQPDEAIRFLTVAVALRPSSPGAHLNLGNVLAEKGQVDEAIACYQKAIDLDPEYAQAHTNLGNGLHTRGRLDEAIACFKKVIELSPHDAQAHYNLGVTLTASGRLDDAIACFRKAVELHPKYAEAHYNLGATLTARGQADEAIASYKKAIDLSPNDAKARNNLGAILSEVKRDYDGAIAHLRKAVELDPKLASAHNNLGNALKGKGQVDEAIASYKKAVELDPNDAKAHNNLGGILCDAKRDYDGAIACFRKAIELGPNDATAHFNLGNALKGKGQVDEAIACYKKASELSPNEAMPHFNLGNALQARGRLDEAIDCYRKAIAIDPNFPEAHCNLGYALKGRGDFAEALGPFRRGHELGSQRRGWQYPSASWVRDCERLIEREKRLLAVLAGSSEPADARERLEWAGLCVQTRRYAAAARLSGEAFGAEEELANDLGAGHRYRAGTAAALAGAGRGRDAGELTDEARVALRKQALDWLKADLAAWRVHGDGSRRVLTLRGWRADRALAGVRDEVGLAKLPPPERAAWGEFWADVEKLLKPSR
jgi:tetratricopeptide (TPR) repeat protein